MRIVFFPESTVPFFGKSLEVRPLGGTETAVIRLAEKLSDKGHEVFVFSDFDNPPVTNPLYISKASLSLIKETDVFVAVRDWRGLFANISSKKSFFWSGDAHDQPVTFGIGDKRVIDKADSFLCVSKWHSEEFSRFLPQSKIQILKNGVHLPFFSIPRKKKHKSLIYSSTPYRGLVLLPQIFSQILKLHPDAILSIYSGYEVYSSDRQALDPQQKEFEEIKKKFSGIKNVTFYGNVNQEELSKAFLEHEVLAYPNIFPETSCITVMEAQAGGAIPVTSSLGALSETVGNAGVLVSGVPGSKEYADNFVGVVDKIFSDNFYKEALIRKCKETCLNNSWEIRAEEFLKFCG